MSYIQNLRRSVGNVPLVLVGATVLVFNDRDELLMLLRTDNGCWGVPGGVMEPGELIQNTARRETREETGLLIDHLYLYDVFSGLELYYRYPNGDQVFNVSVVYIAPEAAGEIELNPDEHSQWKYYPLDQLPENISPPIKSILAKFFDVPKPLRRVIHYE